MKVLTGLLALAVVALGGFVVGSRTGGTSAPATSTSRSVPPPSAPKRTGMDESTFWALVAATRTAADNDTGRQSSLLEERLSHLPPQQIVDFWRIRKRFDRQVYTWDIWGAAFVIEDGCSDDCFRDFRAYLISLGRGPYEAALRDPDSLAPVVQDAERGDWENADDVAPDAYSSRTGHDFPFDDSDLSGPPRGRPWDDSRQGVLIRRYPRLAARFR